MEADVEVDYSPAFKVAEGVPEEDVRVMALDGLSELVHQVAREELGRAGQKWKGGDTEPRGSGDWVDFDVHFEGDTEGAKAAYERWCARVEAIGGVARIGHAALRGSDGTNLQYFDQQTVDEYDALPEEIRDQISRTMNPDG